MSKTTSCIFRLLPFFEAPPDSEESLRYAIRGLEYDAHPPAPRADENCAPELPVTLRALAENSIAREMNQATDTWSAPISLSPFTHRWAECPNRKLPAMMNSNPRCCPPFCAN